MHDSTKTGLGLQDIIGDKREQILQRAARHRAVNVRVFGSVARGEATPESDVDFLVDFQQGATMWDAVALWRELRKLLEREVNVVAEELPHDRFMRAALKDAVPL